MAFYPVKQKAATTPVVKALKKKGAALTVSLEYRGSGTATIDDEIDGERRTIALTSDEILSKLSGELRSTCKTSALFTADVGTLEVLATEQQRANGDFPGPCPVIFNGASSEAEAAIAAGANGVVLTSASIAQSKELPVEVVWSVASAEEIQAIVNDENAPQGIFLFDAADAASLMLDVPAGALAIAAVDAMAAAEGEIDAGLGVVGAGCKSVLVRKACVGDAEDLPYASYAVKRLTSKKSSSFAIDGHTGSVNGHFGGARGGGGVVPEGGWKRVAVQ